MQQTDLDDISFVCQGFVLWSIPQYTIQIQIADIKTMTWRYGRLARFRHYTFHFSPVDSLPTHHRRLKYDGRDVEMTYLWAETVFYGH